jgi:hypothetical protein
MGMEETPAQPDRRRRKLRPALGFGIVAVVLLTMAAVFGYLVFMESGSIPRTYRKGLDFSLYYPAQLPEGYYVDKRSFKREGAVLIFSIKRTGSKSVVVSQQALPTDQPVHKASNSPTPLAGERDFKTAVGDVHIGLWGDKYVADIITDDSWIIMNMTGYTTDEAEAIVKALRAID